MAKRTGNSSVNSSIREGTKTQEAGFKQLLELQKISTEHLNTIREAISVDSQKLSALVAINALGGIEQKKIDKTIVNEGDSLDNIEEYQKELVALAKENAIITERNATAITAVAASMKTFKSFGDKLNDLKFAFKEKYGKGNIGRTALSAVNVGGLLNKKIAQGDFIKQQKALGSTKSDKELKTDFAGAQKASKSIKANENAIERLKKVTGLTDEAQLAKTPEGGKLIAARSALSDDYSKYDKKSEFVKESEVTAKKSKDDAKISIATVRSSEEPVKVGREPEASPDVAKKDISEKRNTEIPIPIKISETIKSSPDVAKKDISEKRKVIVSKDDRGIGLRLQQQQLFLLKQLVANTTIGTRAKVARATGGSAGGIGESIAGGIGSMGDALGKLGKGIGAGLQGMLEGLARGFSALTNPTSLIGMGAFTLAAIGIGKALEMAAPAIEAFAPVLMKVAEVVGGVFIEAIRAIPEILKSVGDVIVNIVTTISNAITGIMNSIITSIERLAAVDGSNLLSIGAGLLSVGAGMAAFAAGGVAQGVSNLVTGFLGAVTGQKSPIEQLEQIAKLGPGLSQAGLGIEKLSAGLSSFGSTSGSKVASMSEQTVALKDKAIAASNIVSAPMVNNNVKQTSIAKVSSGVRTNESSVDRYFSARAVY
jgi:hypothetical protein